MCEPSFSLLCLSKLSWMVLGCTRRFTRTALGSTLLAFGQCDVTLPNPSGVLRVIGLVDHQTEGSTFDRDRCEVQRDVQRATQVKMHNPSALDGTVSIPVEAPTTPWAELTTDRPQAHSWKCDSCCTLEAKNIKRNRQGARGATVPSLGLHHVLVSRPSTGSGVSDRSSPEARSHSPSVSSSSVIPSQLVSVGLLHGTNGWTDGGAPALLKAHLGTCNVADKTIPVAQCE